MKNKNDYVQITNFWDIEQMHLALHQFKFDNPDKKGYAEFNGFIFFTDDDDLTIDHFYQTICGEPKAEHKAKQDQWLKDYSKRDLLQNTTNCELISSFIINGLQILPPEHYEKWIKIVPVRVMDLYHGWDLDNFLELYIALQNETFESVKDRFYEQGHSGGSASIILGMLKEFSPKGKEFFEFLRG